jgi:hypothetical protein
LFEKIVVGEGSLRNISFVVFVYSTYIDEGGKFLTFSIAYFPNEDKEREFLTIGMIKGPNIRAYKEIIDQIQQTVTLTPEKKLPVKNKPLAIIVTKTILKTDKVEYSMGDEITVTFKNVSAESNSEWIGMYKVGTEKTDYLQWRYLEEKKAGEFIFKTPEEAGEYIFKLFDQNYEELSISQPFTVKEIKLPSIMLDYETYLEALPITISFNHAPAQSEKDWIAIYKVDAEDTAYISGQYLGGKKAGELTFNAPEETGAYNFRMFSSESYNRVAMSKTITIEKTTLPVVQKDPGIGENLFINEYALCSDIVDNKPAGKKLKFTFAEKKLCMWLQIDKYVVGHEAKWEWIKPDGSVYESVELTLKSASEYGYAEINQYNIWSWLTPTSMDKSTGGIWRIQFYLDDQLILTRQFMLMDN